MRMQPWTNRLGYLLGFVAAGGLFSGCASRTPPLPVPPLASPASQTVSPEQESPSVAVPLASMTPFQRAIVTDLERQTRANTVYDNSYFSGGIPPANLGVCSDVAIRAFQAAGIDLKRAVTADIRAHQRLYPLSHPDPNIDHRRCRNLVVYCKRYAKELPISPKKAYWQPGDIVFWSTGGKSYLDHIGIIGNHIGPSGNPTVVQHLPGAYVNETDTLYQFQVLHHFRWNAR